MNSDESIQNLLREAKSYYRKNNRSHLPWRKTKDSYKILVSEIMLQQTQVERVIPKYNLFIKKFPTAKKLGNADLPEVLKLWQGLGYNRRGKMLRDAARQITGQFAGRFPRTVTEINSLSGVGKYTAGAIAAFAFNSPEIFVETNIRTIFLHRCFTDQKNISDEKILPLVELALKKSKMSSRDFYAMLMDYGSHLKKSGIKNNSSSKHYLKQSKFEGSRRQLRGQILKLLLQKPLTKKEIVKLSNRKPVEVFEELARLQKEKMISYKNKKFVIEK